MKQIVNLHTTGPTWIRDADQRRVWEEQAHAIRRDMTKRGVRYQVAPDQAHRRADGRVLAAGAPLTLADFEGFTDDQRRPIPAWRLAEEAVRCCRVLEAALPQGPTAA